MPEEVPAKDIGFKTPEEAIAATKGIRERIGAVTDKTPGVVMRAFIQDPIDIATLELPPITMRTWLRLEKIKSPFLRSDASEVTMEELLATFYVIAGDIAEVGRNVIAGGVKFAEAVDAFAARIPLSAMGELSKKLGEHFRREFEPQANFSDPNAEGSDGPKAPASSATEQAAG